MTSYQQFTDWIKLAVADVERMAQHDDYPRCYPLEMIREGIERAVRRSVPAPIADEIINRIVHCRNWDWEYSDGRLIDDPGFVVLSVALGYVENEYPISDHEALQSNLAENVTRFNDDIEILATTMVVGSSVYVGLGLVGYWRAVVDRSYLREIVTDHTIQYCRSIDNRAYMNA